MPPRRAFGCAACVLAAACGNRTRAAAGDDPPVAIPSGATVVTGAPAAFTAPPSAPVTSGSGPVRAAPFSFAPIVHAVDASVVTITTIGEQVEVSPFTHQARRRQTQGLGTGFVVDKTGIILTNNHVVEGAEAIQVKLSDERRLTGRVVGTDPQTDVAVIRVDAADLRPLSLGDSDRIEVGDWVVAIGNPMALSHTVSAGIISAKGRTQKDVPLDPSGYYDFLQTDASINPGNSGGPLLDLNGAVVGINDAIRGDAQGIAFAIPINLVKQLLPMLLRDGHVTRSALGVQISDARDLGAEDRQALKIPEGTKILGAVIEAVVRDGPAHRAGLQEGDIVVAFDGQPIERSSKLQWLASTAGVGRQVTLRVQRSTKSFEVKVTLGLLPRQPSDGVPR
jgi:serine protease Do